MTATIIKSSEEKRTEHFRKKAARERELKEEAYTELKSLRTDVRELRHLLDASRREYAKAATAAVNFQKKLEQIRSIANE